MMPVKLFLSSDGSRRLQTLKKPRPLSNPEQELNTKAARMLNLTPRSSTARRRRPRPKLKLSRTSLKPPLPPSSTSTRCFNEALCGQKVGFHKRSFTAIPNSHRLRSFLEKAPAERQVKHSCASQADFSGEPGDQCLSISVKFTWKSYHSARRNSHSVQTDEVDT